MASEFDLIRRYFTRPVAMASLGAGDDCALIEAHGRLAISTDTLVEGTHFFANTQAGALGHKALAVSLSDLAAMGAAPRYGLLALTLAHADEAWIAQFAGGFFALAADQSIEIIGGDTTRGPLSITVTVVGELEPGQALRRDGARAGDEVWVSGTLGAAALGVRLLRGEASVGPAERAEALAALERPQPQVALGRALLGLASSAIDVSDGLGADLGHIARCSGVAIQLQAERIPLGPALQALDDPGLALELALTGGDDYQLAFTAPSQAGREIAARAANLGVAVTRIGRVVTGGAVSLMDRDGNPIALARTGFDHFAP